MRLRLDATAVVVGTAEFTKNSHGVDDPAGGNADNGGRRTGSSISTTEAWRAIR
jgi:hypothetical protein